MIETLFLLFIANYILVVIYIYNEDITTKEFLVIMIPFLFLGCWVISIFFKILDILKQTYQIIVWKIKKGE